MLDYHVHALVARERAADLAQAAEAARQARAAVAGTPTRKTRRSRGAIARRTGRLAGAVRLLGHRAR